MSCKSGGNEPLNLSTKYQPPTDIIHNNNYCIIYISYDAVSTRKDLITIDIYFNCVWGSALFGLLNFRTQKWINWFMVLCNYVVDVVMMRVSYGKNYDWSLKHYYDECL